MKNKGFSQIRESSFETKRYRHAQVFEGLFVSESTPLKSASEIDL
ncbi:hypothetical protein ALQ58_200066 [Pseudomonas syringae pv. apii]|nr:hypothetical protein ALQ58_200066 [Pseudomonas syringae pv. apii]